MPNQPAWPRVVLIWSKSRDFGEDEGSAAVLRVAADVQGVPEFYLAMSNVVISK